MYCTKQTKKLLFLVFVIILLFSSGFFVFFSNRVSAQSASDAIAIRVIPNPNHYSASLWYQKKEFTGSPQSLIVDGYEAVRDGRTVYVNAANVDLGANALYTNIYLISYNQDAEINTVDIFSRILDSWKLNSNLPDFGACNASTDIFCLYDDGCPKEEYCLSEKARVTRDTKRLAELTELGAALERYKAGEGRYPVLPAGTYLANKSLSVWPSWKKVLGQLLRYNIPVDPINKLGDCGGANYHPITCWDEDTKTFPTNLDIPVFPTDSRVYFYSTDNNGDTVNYCALLETSYPNIGSFNCVSGSAGNNPPRFTGIGLPPGPIGEDYYGYLEAIDPDGDSLAWSVSGPPPSLFTAGIPSQRTIFVPNLSSNVNFTATIDDGRGGVVSQNFTIITTVSAGIDVPTVGAVSDYDIIIGSDISFSISGNEPNSEYPLKFDFLGAPSGFNSTGSLDSNGFTMNVSGDVIDITKNYNVTLTVFDSSGHASAPVGFNINVRNNPPTISSASLPGAVGCAPYSFIINAADIDGHKLTFLMDGPAGLDISADTGEIAGRVIAGAGTYPVRITVRDEYYDFTAAPHSAEAVRDFTLNVSDETYNLTMPNAYDFYASPQGVEPEDLYYGPTSYFGVADKSTTNRVAWSMDTTPNPLMSGLFFTINPDNGEITAQTTNSNISPGGYNFTGQINALTYDCNIPASGTLNLTVYRNEWCGDGTVQAIEECEAPGAGSGENDQYDCISCSWSGGWCGNGICDYGYESYSSCFSDCISANSQFSVCTDYISQPTCYNNSFPTPTLNWVFNATSNEFCDCDGIPIDDCPTGIPCLASTQVTYEIHIDNDSDYLSPEKTIGPISSQNDYHKITTPGLHFDWWYFWQLRVRDSFGTLTPWVQCTGPFLVNPNCDDAGMTQETTAPVVNSFTVVAGPAIISWNVTDAGGSHLDRIEVWRAPDVGGAPGTWQEVTGLRQMIGGSNVDAHSGSVIDNPLPGNWWYGIHVYDQDGNAGFEPNPPGPINIIVN